jgi:hypothetical protein
VRRCADLSGIDPWARHHPIAVTSSRTTVVHFTSFPKAHLHFHAADISQLGDARKVAKLLIPPGAVVAGVTSTAVAQPPRDTGTVLGVIERQPVTYYTYDLLLPDPAATRVQLTAAAQLGRLYVLAASAPGQEWGEAGPLLREAALSFRVRYKI